MPLHNPHDVAPFFAASAGQALAWRRVHHLLFLAQAWSMAIARAPLLDGAFLAEETGPVHRDLPLYGMPLQPRRVTRMDFLSGSEQALLERVWVRYGPSAAPDLSRIVLHPTAPWAQTFFDTPSGRGAPISRFRMGSWAARLALEGRAQARAQALAA